MRLPDHVLSKRVTTNFPLHLSGALGSSRLLPSIILLIIPQPALHPLREARVRGCRRPGLRDQSVPPPVIDAKLRPGREGLTQDHPERGRRSWDWGPAS